MKFWVISGLIVLGLTGGWVYAQSGVNSYISFENAGFLPSMNSGVTANLEDGTIKGTALAEGEFGKTFISFFGPLDTKTLSFNTKFEGYDDYDFSKKVGRQSFRRTVFNGELIGRLSYQNEQETRWEGIVKIIYTNSEFAGVLVAGPEINKEYQGVFSLDVSRVIGIGEKNSISANVLKISGEAGYLDGGNEPIIALKENEELNDNDIIVTDNRSEVLLQIGSGTQVVILENSKVRIGQIFEKEKSEKGRLSVLSGGVGVRLIPVSDATSSLDVVTPTAVASLKDFSQNEIIVVYNDESNETAVYTRLGEAGVRGILSESEIQIAFGSSIKIANEGRIIDIGSFNDDELPRIKTKFFEKSEKNLKLSNLLWLSALVLAVLAAMGWRFYKKRYK